MRHNFRVEGSGFTLRPVADADAEFIELLRSNPSLNSFIHRSPPGHSQQLAWLTAYYTRPDDYYFVVEDMTGSERHGLVSLYNLDTSREKAEWGRWIIAPGSLAAIESVLLVFRFAFEILSLRSVYSRTLAENRSVLSFHDSVGIPRIRDMPGEFIFGDRKRDAVLHELTLGGWLSIEHRLELIAKKTATRLSGA